MFFILSSCYNDFDENSLILDDSYELTIDARLPSYGDGYYELSLNNNTVQTIHRLSGRLLKNGKEPYPPEKVYWESSHTWTLSDSLGYIIRRVIDYNGNWKNVDTLFIRGYKNSIVPTINCCSYSGTNGEINTVIAPIKEMKGDTLIIKTKFKKETKITKIILK